MNEPSNAALQLRRAQAFKLCGKKNVEKHAIEASAASACYARRKQRNFRLIDRNNFNDVIQTCNLIVLNFPG
jgi:hypothetical protein